MHSPEAGGEVDALQNWLQIRFSCLQPEDLCGSACIAIYSSSPLGAPSGFEYIWRSIDEHHRVESIVPEDECLLLHSSKVLLVIADLHDSRQMQAVRDFSGFICRFFGRRQVPHVIFLQHSVAPCSEETTELRALPNTIHDVIKDRFVSFKLAWAIQNRIFQNNVVKQELQECVLEKSGAVQWKRFLKCCISQACWGYLRARLNTYLPPVDPSIEPGQATIVDGIRIGTRLGIGSRGTEVRGLIQDGIAIGQVLKIVPKRGIRSVLGIKALGEQIEVMTLLSSASWKHPNVIQMTKIYHSETHIYFRLQHGGHRNLEKRLLARDNGHSSSAALGPRKVLSALRQVSSAVCHLHTAVQVVHLDINPKNLIVSERADEVHISLTDFDAAMIQPPLACSGLVGTFPFIAPEVYHQDFYNPYAADIWSMAVVFLDVSCRVNVIKEFLQLPRVPIYARPCVITSHIKRMLAIIQRFFSQEKSTSRLLEAYLDPALRDIVGSLTLLLPLMLEASGSRATCPQVVRLCMQHEEKHSLH